MVRKFAAAFTLSLPAVCGLAQSPQSKPLTVSDLLGSWEETEKSEYVVPGEYEFLPDGALEIRRVNVERGTYSIASSTAIDVNMPKYKPEKWEILACNGRMLKFRIAMQGQKGVWYAVRQLARMEPYQPKQSRPDIEAGELANEYWSRQYDHCGEFYLTKKGRGTFRAAKGLRSTVQALPLSEADRLNGIQWLGITTLTASAAREFDAYLRGWMPWGKWLWDEKYELRKQNGKWNIKPLTPYQEVDWSRQRHRYGDGACGTYPGFELDATKHPHYTPPPGVR